MHVFIYILSFANDNVFADMCMCLYIVCHLYMLMIREAAGAYFEQRLDSGSCRGLLARAYALAVL